MWRRCGKPNCACARPGHRGHGPQWNLTRRVGGKTVNVHLRPGPELDKAEREGRRAPAVRRRGGRRDGGQRGDLRGRDLRPDGKRGLAARLTRDGLLFIDFETCCRGPIEFDVAHVPQEVSARYPDVDRVLLAQGRRLVLAMVAAWRCDIREEFPD